MIRKAVILAAGLGTRLLPFSKEIPKEMIPLYDLSYKHIILKPTIQIIYEHIFDAGIREICIIVGRGKRAIEDHFTPDWPFIELLEKKGKYKQANIIREFYEKLEKTSFTWVNQSRPLGTGNALLQAKWFIDDEPVIVCAGDSIFIGKNMVKELIRVNNITNGNIVVVKKVDNPKKHGVVIPGKKISRNIIKIVDMIEKPLRPPSNLANMSYYLFQPSIVDELKTLKPSTRKEYELTDAIRGLIKRYNNVYGLITRSIRIDIGEACSYMKSLSLSYKYTSKRINSLINI